MSRLGEQAAKAEAGIAGLETALERTQRALQAAERVDAAAGGARRRYGRFVKLVLVLTIIGVGVLIVRKLMAGDPGAVPAPIPPETAPRPDPLPHPEPVSSNGEGPAGERRTSATDPSV
jgi:hypothetical protein